MRSNSDDAKFEVSVAGEVWVQVISLAKAGPHEKVFVLDRESGTVSFGDGVHGERPPIGGSVKVSYQAADRARGNVAVSTVFDWPPRRHSLQVVFVPQGVAFQATDNVEEQLSGEKRPRYFAGELLTADDFRDEQTYFLRKLRRHNRLLHGWGVVEGLGLTIQGEGLGASLVISAGYAIDREGNEIIVNAPICITVGSRPTPQYLVLKYTEQLTDSVLSAAGGGEGERELQATRVAEGVVASLASTEIDGLMVGRLLRKDSNWRVDRTFKPRRIR